MRGPVLVYTLGATALQKYDGELKGMALRLQPGELLAAAMPCGIEARLERAFPYRSGAELTFEMLLEVAQCIEATDAAVAGYVLLCGTDTLEEAAWAAQLMLGTALRRRSRPLVLTGAMLPADQPGSDGPRNLRDAIKVAASPATAALPGGVLVTLNGDIHLAQYVRKADSQLLGAFRSHPGPIGQLRGGQPLFYYAPPPAVAPCFLPDDAFLRLSPAALRTRVAIWPLAVSAFLPDSLLGELDGLVLAGSGTGSLPAALVEQLAPWTRRLPIVVASRCGAGANHDDFLYRGSRAKYEDRGFILGRGYEQLSPLQARTLLVLRLSAYNTG